MPVLSIGFFYFGGIWAAKYDRLRALVSISQKSWRNWLTVNMIPILWIPVVLGVIIIDQVVSGGGFLRGLADMLGPMLILPFPEVPEQTLVKYERDEGAFRQ